MAWKFQSVSVFLTYPHCPIGKETLLVRLQELLEPYTPKYTVVCDEQHEDGEPHLHALILLTKRLLTHNERFFDLDGHHPNIQSARNKSATIAYVKKHGDFIEDGDSPVKRKWVEVLTAGDRDEAAQRIREISPRDWVLSYDRVQHYLDTAFPQQRETYTSDYSFDAAVIPAGIRRWLDQRHESARPLSLLIIGPSRTGKTELARSFGHHIYWNGYFDLRQYDNSAEYAIFDDIPWERFEFMAKQWLGAQKEFTCTDKYCRKQTIRWGRPTIYISNTDPRDKMDDHIREWLQHNVITQIIHNKLF